MICRGGNDAVGRVRLRHKHQDRIQHTTDFANVIRQTPSNLSDRYTPRVFATASNNNLSLLAVSPKNRLKSESTQCRRRSSESMGWGHGDPALAADQLRASGTQSKLASH